MLIERSGKSCIKVDTVEFSIDTLKELYGEIINYIGETVRYGYSNFGSVEKIGSINNPIVDIENHRKFVRAIKQISKEKITKYNFFTTNYDTLLEDALALEHQDIVDGFWVEQLDSGIRTKHMNRHKKKEHIRYSSYTVLQIGIWEQTRN